MKNMAVYDKFGEFLFTPFVLIKCIPSTSNMGGIL